MFFKITLLLIILILFYLLLEFSIKRESFSNKNNFKSKESLIQNFIAYPNHQPFCASLHSSKAKYWSKLPLKQCKGLYVKYCCTGCYYKICKIITCSNNKNGIYKVCKFNSKDIKNLKEYYDKRNKKNNNKLDFDFNENKLNKLKNKHVLKYKQDGIYYPVQLLKYKKDMGDIDIITNNVLNKKYKCN
jgi:hypothetical protein